MNRPRAENLANKENSIRSSFAQYRTFAHSIYNGFEPTILSIPDWCVNNISNEGPPSASTTSQKPKVPLKVRFSLTLLSQAD